MSNVVERTCSRERARLVLVALTILSLAVASTSLALIILYYNLNFEDLTPGTVVTDQYRNFGGPDTGVVLGQGPFGFTAGATATVKEVAPGAAPSGTHVLGISNPAGEFPRYGIWGWFPGGGKHVVKLSIGAPAGDVTRTVTLVGVDAAGNDIPGVWSTVTVVADGQYKTPMSISDASGRIAFFKIVEMGQTHPGTWIDFVNHSIDDLVFDPPQTNPTPDFALVLDLNATAGMPITVSRGGTSSQAARVVVNRVGGSFGPIIATAVGLPSGVSPHVVADSNDNPTEFSVTLSATASATVVVNGSFTFGAFPSTTAVGSEPRFVSIPFSIVEDYDLVVSGIDLTQGIQYTQPLPPRPANPAGAATYSGVPLVERKKTIARVFAAVATPAGATVKGATLLLHGRTSGGTPLPGSPLAKVLPQALTNGDVGQVTVGTIESGNPAATFTLPPDWTSAGPIELEAEIIPPAVLLSGATECCPGNNQYRLSNVKFADTGFLKVYALLLKTGKEFPGFPDDLLTAAAQVLPLADGELRTGGDWRAVYDISPIVSAKTWGDLIPNQCGDLGIPCDGPIDKDKLLIGYAENYDFSQPYCFSVFPAKNAACPDVVTALGDHGIVGLSRGSVLQLRSRNVANIHRPLTSMAHELSHGLGLHHASGGCGGGANGQKSDAWPDGWGSVLGIGYDVRYGTVLYPGSAGDNNPGAAAAGAPSDSWLDYMSYCANVGCSCFKDPGCGSCAWGEVGVNTDSYHPLDPVYPYELWDAWISTKNWSRVHSTLQVLKNLKFTSAKAVADAGAVGDGASEYGLAVRAFLDDGYVVVSRVGPAPVRLVPPAESFARLVLRDAAGGIVAETPMTVESSEGHGAEAIFLDADVPLGAGGPSALPPSLRAVEVELNGRLAARVERSANPPQVEFRRLRHKLQKKNVTFRWRSFDADGDPLTATVDYSTDDGNSWSTVYRGPDEQHVKLPGYLFPGSQTARLRVRVSDGFDEAVAVSDQLKAPGRRPEITITSPERRDRFTTNDAVYLSATAYGDDFESLASGIVWQVGRNVIATGSPASVRGLRPGRHTIHAIVRDASGRLGKARVKIRIQRAPPPPESRVTRTPRATGGGVTKP